MEFNNLIQEVISEDNIVVIKNNEIIHKNITNNLIVEKLSAQDDLVKNYVGKCLSHEGNDFKKPNQLEEVILIKLNKSQKETLQVVYAYEANGETNEQIMIVTEPFAELTYIENKVSINLDDHKIISNVEIINEESSHLHFTAFNELCDGVNIEYYRTALVHQYANFNIAVSELNEGNVVGYNYTNLVGEASNADSKIVTIAKEEQKQYFTVRINHYAKHSIGNILNHGVVKDKAYAKFDGIGFIAKGQIKSNAQQTSKMMILDKEGKAEANPILLIDEHDVLAGHAATVGQVDENHLYYLMSRGLSRKDAEKLIIFGFLMPVVENLDNEKLKDKFISSIQRKI